MARPARRTARSRGRPSYREDSFDSAQNDGDYSESDADIGPSLSVRRKGQQFARDSSIVDSDPRVGRSSRRRAKRPSFEDLLSDLKSFIVSDDDEEEDEADDDESTDASEHAVRPIQTSRKRKAPTAARSTSKRARTSKAKKSANSKKSRTTRNGSSTASRNTKSSPRKPQSRTEKAAVQIESDGVRPPWSSLPYLTLVRVFEYASWSYEDNTRNRIAWLSSAARTCKTFCEPALTVLYNRLSVSDFRQIAALQFCLESQTEDTAFDYRAKVQQISLDERILQNGWNPNDLLNLLPVVSKLDIWSSKDILRGHPQLASERWYTYPTAFFIDMRANLKSWRLNGMMLSNMDEVKLLFDLMASESCPFNSLSELTVTNMLVNYPTCSPRFGYAEQVGYNDQDNFLPFLPKMLNLSKLRVEFSRAFHAGEAGPGRFASSGGILGNLRPHLLQSLELHGCLDDSPGLQVWLSEHGRSLRRLSIQNCPHMNLSFMQDLAQHCPDLVDLSIDLQLTDPAFHDRRIVPSFNLLMSQEEVPTWPENLQNIQMQHLQKWTIDEAKVAFESLIDAAPRLNDLRSLVISASVDGEWKARSLFRDEWQAKFQHVFLRKSAPPNKHLMSKKAWRLYLAAKQKKQQKEKEEDNLVAGRLRKRSLRVHYGSDSSDDSEAGSVTYNNGHVDGSNSRQSRNGTSGKGKQTRGSVRQEDDVEVEKELFVQGLCDVVDIRIDNQRPTAKEMNENDFLEPDEHDESDEDYEA